MDKLASQEVKPLTAEEMRRTLTPEELRELIRRQREKLYAERILWQLASLEAEVRTSA